MKMKMKSDVEMVVWDSNECEEAIKMIKKSLRKMGLHVYSNPHTSNSTCRGIIISKSKMTKKDIYKKGKETWLCL